MFADQTVIYAARSIQDAYALRNRLSESGIEAVVLTDLSDPIRAEGTEGGTVVARVAVSTADAAKARHIAQVFDRKSATPPGGLPGGGKPQPALPDGWPCCPECDTPRITRCPICRTTGTAFRPADMDFVDPEDPELNILDPTAPARLASGCGCGPHGCSPQHQAEDDSSAASSCPPDASGQRGAELVLICPTCDEPFVPQFAATCAWCGFEFPGGIEVEHEAVEVEAVGHRVVVVLFALVVLLFFALAFLAYVI